MDELRPIFQRDPISHLERAQALLDMEKPDKAIEELRHELARDPNSWRAEAMMAYAYTQLQNLRAADFHIRNALSLEPEDGHTHYFYGCLLLAHKKWKAAEREFQLAIQLSPGEPDAYYGYARLKFARGNHPHAEELLRRALWLDPSHIRSLNLLALLLIENRRVEEAQAALVESMKLDALESESHAARGLMFLHQLDAEQAFEKFREALRLDPNNAEVKQLYWRARIGRRPVIGWLINGIMAIYQLPIPKRLLLIPLFLVFNILVRILQDANQAFFEVHTYFYYWTVVLERFIFVVCLMIVISIQQTLFRRWGWSD